MNVETSRTLGGVGALLMVIGPLVGAYTGILALIGLILTLIAVKGLADNYNDQGMFNNALYGVIMLIIGVVAFIGVLFVAAFGLFAAIGIDIAQLTNFTTAESIFSQIDWSGMMDINTIMPYIAIAIASFIILFIFAIVAAIFLRKSCNLLAAKTGVGMFSTTGLLILIGAILTIVLVGFLLLWIALILLAVAFFSIRTTAPQPTAPTQPAT